LKGINDGEGRAAGDHVLRSIGQVLQARTRPFDAIVRYGGDEFLCILSGAAIEDARRRLASISQDVLESSGVTLSVGLAQLTDGDLAHDLIDRARVSMLMEKTARRS
jgi:diguanylate cyclase (GGDEF)-like protein